MERRRLVFAAIPACREQLKARYACELSFYEGFTTQSHESIDTLTYGPLINCHGQCNNSSSTVPRLGMLALVWYIVGKCTMTGRFLDENINANTHLVPTTRSKNAWIDNSPPSSTSIDFKTSSSKIPRIPPLFRLVRELQDGCKWETIILTRREIGCALQHTQGCSKFAIAPQSCPR